MAFREFFFFTSILHPKKLYTFCNFSFSVSSSFRERHQICGDVAPKTLSNSCPVLLVHDSFNDLGLFFKVMGGPKLQWMIVFSCFDCD